MGQLRDKRIVQSRIWLDPNEQPIPDLDYDFSYPITVYDAIRRTMEDDSTTLMEELDSIYRLISGKQDRIPGGNAGHLMTWSGVPGTIGDVEIVKKINSDLTATSHQKVPSERAVADELSNKLNITAFSSHVQDDDIHLEVGEREKWDSMTPLWTHRSHAENADIHITTDERSRWDLKADQSALEDHVDNISNPHNVTAHQVGTYNRPEIDDMFANLRESFFNYKNIEFDSRTNEARLVEYKAVNWNPNYVLAFGDDLPDVVDDTLTYFALRPVTDYSTEESNDCAIFAKLPGLLGWQELGVQKMEVGDLVLRYPDTNMYVWVQGRFKSLFNGSAADSSGGPITGAVSNLLWRPIISAEGVLNWTRSSEENAPAGYTIKGAPGYTPIKGIDYNDGADGQGVPLGGTKGDFLFKVSDDDYDTAWKSFAEALGDLIMEGGGLPEGVIAWGSVAGRPEWYDELGNNSDGFITQRAATEQFNYVADQIQNILEKIDSESGLDAINTKIDEHLSDYQNPHHTTPAQIGAVSNASFADHVQNYNNPHNVTAAQIGLGNVNNTADLDKPISTATQAVLDDLLRRLRTLNESLNSGNAVANVMWNNTSCTLTFAFRDGSELDIRLPIIDIFKTIYYDEVNRELVIVLPDGSENRINIQSLITAYYGSTSRHITVEIDPNGTISAIINPDTIGEGEIVASVNLRGSPTTTTQMPTDKSTRIATTEFVKSTVIDNLISYETDRPLSANMGRILNQHKADIEDVLQIIMDMSALDVIDNLDSTSAVAALSANMGRYLDLTKAPRVHTSPSGSTFGRATIDLFGHTRASSIEPLMDGTAFVGTDDGYYARGNHRHPTDISRAPMHWPDVEHGQYAFTGEPRSTLPPDDSNDDRIATTEWIRRNAVGCMEGDCNTPGGDNTKIVTLRSSFMENPVFLRQIGSTVAVSFAEDDVSEDEVVYLNVHDSGPAPVLFGGLPIINGMIKGNHTYLFTFDGVNWWLQNPSGIHPLADDDNSNAYVSSEWVRRNIVGCMKGECNTSSGNYNKVATLRSSFMDPVVFVRQIGSTVAITFRNEDTSGATPTTLNVNDSGAARITYAGKAVTNGLIGKRHTHMFVFDGEDWNLINPVVPGIGEITFGPNPAPDPDDPDDTPETVINRLSGYSGLTTQADGPIDEHGQVSRAWIAINFSPKMSDVEANFSDYRNCWAVKMGDGTVIKANDPTVIEATRSSVLVQFTLETPYPSNSPCQLMYRTNKAWLTVKEI